VQKGNAIFLPVSLQVHHAVCDGYHAGLFMNYLQSFADKSFCKKEFLLITETLF